jgi:hypothetical protein
MMWHLLVQGVGFVIPTATPTERTPDLPRVLIGDVNQLMVVGSCHAALYKGGERSGHA